MGANTHIEWAHHTFNPWEGCTKVSPGCANCYAENRNARFGGGTAPNWGKGAPRRRTSASNWAQPVKWNKEAKAAQAAHWPPSVPYERPRVFCASLADWLDDEVPTEWLADLLALIDATPNLDWLLLTKRPENWKQRLIEVEAHLAKGEDMSAWPATLWWVQSWRLGTASANVWIGTTVENQPVAKQRLWDLSNIPARVRFVSAEPLLGPLDLFAACFGDLKFGEQEPQDVLFFDWLICGGESGPNARPMHPDWARSLRDQCKAGCVAFFFKQWGQWAWVLSDDDEDEPMPPGSAPQPIRVGKAAAGRRLDGLEHNEFPEGSQ